MNTEENMFFEYEFENEEGYEKGSVEYYKDLCLETSISLRYDTQRVFEENYTLATKNRDYALLRNVFYHEIKLQIIPLSSGGVDHSHGFRDMLNLIACDDFQNIYRIFPEGLPLASNGYSMYVKATNLVLCMLYNKDGKEVYDQGKVIEQARKYIESKQPVWDRAVVACVLAIMQHDMSCFSENIQKVCEGYSKQDIIKYRKLQCDPAYGLIVLAKHFCTKEEFESIKYPEYKNFDKGYIDWFLNLETFPDDLCFEYKGTYVQMNDILKMPIAKTYIHQPYLGTDNPYISAKSKKDWYVDVKGKMAEEFFESVKDSLIETY